MKNYKTKPLPVQNVSVEEMQNSIGGIQNKLMQAAMAAAEEMGDGLAGGGGGGFLNVSFGNLHGMDSVGLEFIRSGDWSGENAEKMIKQYWFNQLLEKIF